jgi:branched-chain amino acid transport system ATP-binding protein
MMTEHTVILSVRNIYKHFGGLEVLKGVSFNMYKGEILSLIGPNGAGKTTLFNIISGIYAPDQGVVEFEGKKITGLKPHKICRLGIARTFQIAEPIADMNVLENVMASLLFGRNCLSNLEKAKSKAKEILELTGLIDFSETPVESLTIASRRRLELARALGGNPKLILCDEILAGLTPKEISEAIRLLKKINVEMGISLLLVEHVMSAVMAISDRVIVLDRGKIIFDGKPEACVECEEVKTAYLGGV